MEKERHKMEYTEEELQRVAEFLKISDEEFYKRYVMDAPAEEQKAFLLEFPEFNGCVCI